MSCFCYIGRRLHVYREEVLQLGKNVGNQRGLGFNHKSAEDKGVKAGGLASIKKGKYG